MSWTIFNGFCRKNRDFATATTEECTKKDKCTMNSQRTGAGPRAPLGLPGHLEQLGRWAAVAAVAAGERLECARGAEVA